MLSSQHAEKVSVIIPNWNGCRLTNQCLKSLKKQTFNDFLIYVVDNASSDGSVEMVRTEFPDVVLIENQENLGFAGGVNSGIKVAQGEYIALLNNDTEADPEWLQNIVLMLDSHQEYGFASSKILLFDQRDIIDSVGDGYSFTGFAFKLGDLEKDDGQYDSPFEVFGACAAASVYRRTMLDDIGLFDDDFFAYMEDVEINIRAQIAGYRCTTVPSAKIYHMVSATTGGDTSEFSIRMTTKNLINIFVKDIPASLLIIMVPLTMAAQSALILQSIFTDKYPGIRRNLPGYWKGLLDGFKQMPVMLKKRRKINKLRRISTRAFAKRIRESERQKRESRA